MHFSIFNAIFVYCKRELFFKQKSSFLILDLSLGFVVFVAYFYCFAFGYITNYAFCGQSAELHLESIATNIKKKFPRQLILIRDEKIWEKIINWNVDMDCRWTTLRIHLWVWNVQTHVKLFCCGSAQMIMKIDFQQIIIF